MAQTNAQRQASYRAKRKAAEQCIEPGCGNPAAPYTRCETHRLKAKQAAAEGRITKAEHQAVLAGRDELRRLSGPLITELRTLVAERDDLQKRYRELITKHRTVVAERDDLQKRYLELRTKFVKLEVTLEVRQGMLEDPWPDDEEG